MPNLLTSSRRLWRWVSFSRLLLNSIFVVVSKWKKKIHFCLALWRQTSQSSNKRCNKVMRIRVARENVSLKNFEVRDTVIGTISHPRCCLHSLEGLLLGTSQFGVENSTISEVVSLTWLFNLWRVQLSRESSSHLLYNPQIELYNLFIVSREIALQIEVFLGESVTLE